MMSDPADIRFWAEPTLGKLAKWLRILGFDTASGRVDDAVWSDPDRILLTRTRHVFRQAADRRVVFIHSNDPMDQVRELISVLDIQKAQLRPFSRCTRCNRPVRSIEKAAVRERVPDYVWQTQRRFCACPQCGRIYWAGTHIERGRRRIEKFFGGAVHRFPKDDDVDENERLR